MMYHDKSRFEINRLVAQKLGMSTDKYTLHAHAISHEFNDRYPDMVWAQRTNEPWEQFCFTSLPEQWGELVRDYSINLSFDTCQVHAESYFGSKGKVSKSRNDIGLAVCIAFLQMKDSQDENQ